MACDDDDGVLLLIEQDVLDGAGHFTDLRTVLEIVSETHRATIAAKKEERVDVVDVGVLVNH